jgi:hypothetical protein
MYLFIIYIFTYVDISAFFSLQIKHLEYNMFSLLYMNFFFFIKTPYIFCLLLCIFPYIHILYTYCISLVLLKASPAFPIFCYIYIYFFLFLFIKIVLPLSLASLLQVRIRVFPARETRPGGSLCSKFNFLWRVRIKRELNATCYCCCCRSL